MLKGHPVQHSMNISQDLGTSVSGPNSNLFLSLGQFLFLQRAGIVRVDHKWWLTFCI